jgi:hypothetical protein
VEGGLMMRGDSKQYEPRILGANARERVALHEAAHAVAAKAYGLSVSYAEIYTEAWDGRLGQMSFSSKRNSHAWARAVVSLAGPQGELAFCGDEYGSDRDFENAEQDAWKFDPDNGDEVWQKRRR